MVPDFSLQRVLATEERSRYYAQGSMCALKGKRQARVRPAPWVTANCPNSTNNFLITEGFSECIQRPGEKCGLVKLKGSPKRRQRAFSKRRNAAR